MGWWILGGILLLLLILLLCPLRFILGFSEEFSLTVGYLFFHIPVLPGKPKPEKEEKPKEKKEKPAKKGGGKLKEILSRKGFFGFLDSLFELVGMALHSVGKILSHLKLKRFDLYLCVAGEPDAAEGAKLYGELCLGVYGVCGELFALVKPKGTKNRRVTVDLDYGRQENLVDFTGELSIAPLFVIGHGLALVFKAIPKVLDLLGIRLVRRKPKKVDSRPALADRSEER